MQIITGKVQAGAKRGRTLGCPTANLPLADISFSGVCAEANPLVPFGYS